MKNRQFRLLIIAIFLQPVIMYFWRGYWSQTIVYEKADRSQVSELHDMVYKLQDDVSWLVNQTEIIN